MVYMKLILQAFYVDFAHIADDESRHFGWCLQRLSELGYSYGDMVAHGMLWDGALVSAGRLFNNACNASLSLK